MKLNIQERLTMVNLVPEKGNFVTMSIVESLRELLYPSEAEVKKFEIKQTDMTLTWNTEGNKKIEIKITPFQKEFLMNRLEELSQQNNLDIQQYLIYKRFKEETKE